MDCERDLSAEPYARCGSWQRLGEPRDISVDAVATVVVVDDELEIVYGSAAQILHSLLNSRFVCWSSLVKLPSQCSSQQPQRER